MEGGIATEADVEMRFLCPDILTPWGISSDGEVWWLEVLVSYNLCFLNDAISKTGISRNASANVFFKQHEYTIDFFDYPNVLKPSLNLTATVSWDSYQ